MTKSRKTKQELLEELESLRSSLAEAEEILLAIRNGEVDALVAATADGDQVFTLAGAEQPYRVMIEMMNEGAATLSPDGTIIYCNQRFADIVRTSLEKIIGSSIYQYIESREQSLEAFFRNGLTEAFREESTFRAADGTTVPVLLSFSHLADTNAPGSMCLLATDITELRETQEGLQKSHDELELRVNERTAQFRESEERYRLATMAANDAIWDLNLIDGTVDWSDNYATQFGRPKGTGNSWQLWIDHIHPEDREDTGSSLREAVDGSASFWNREYRFLRADGTWAEIFDRAYIARDQSGKAWRVVGAMQDITERKQAEKALQESERREQERAAELEALLDAAPVPIFIAHDIEGIHLTGNKAAVDLLRLLPGSETSLSAPETVRPHHFKAVRDGRELTNDELPAQRAAHGIEVKDFEFSLVFHDGTIRDVIGYGTPMLDRDGNPRGAVHILVDITERKRMEEALAASKKQLQNIIDNTPALVYVLDLEERFLIANHALAEFLNSTPRQMIGKKRREFMSEDTAAQHEANDRKVVEAGRALEFEEYGEFKGRSITFLTSKFPLWDPQGGIYAVAGISTDISERKEMEEALRTYAAKLEDAYKEIEAFSYSVSHDLRAPLRAIDGYARMLLKKHGHEFDEESLRKFNVIRSSSQMMGKLIEDILTLSRLGRHKISIVELDMEGILRDAWKDLQTDTLERRINLQKTACLQAMEIERSLNRFI